MLLYPLRLFEKCPDVLKRYQDRFKHVLVDEYQDTNRAQYRFTQLLGEQAETICVVGDDDQSIYRWRGALLENLEKFREDFAPVEVIPLEENYRSSAPILEGATAVVNENPRRHPKKLRAMRDGDELIHLLTLADEEAEAEKVVSRIDHWTRTTKEFGLSDCAVFFRTAAQSRPIEEILMRRGIPYTLVGGIRFYERKEVKDILAYARAAYNPRDEQALRRIVGLGHWKVGARTLDQTLHLANRLGKCLYELTSEDLTDALRTTGASRFGKLQTTLRNWRDTLGSDELSLSVWFHRIIQQSNYLEHLTEQKSDREAQRQLEGIKQNLDQLVSAAGEFSDQLLEALETSQEPPTLQNQLELFLAQCSLMSDVDYWTNLNQQQDPDFDPGKVTLMTLHSAKGLEFPVVFIVGCEEELIPHSRSSDSVAGLEEERRLMYVGMTRAEKRLVLTCAHTRRIYGRSMSRIRSRFLKDIPSSCIRYVQDEAPASPGREDQLHAGDKVIHKIFGQGRVLGVQGKGMGQKVEVDFFKHGRKTLMQAYAKMRKL